MKIMYVVSSLERGGPTNVLYNIVKEVSSYNDCQIVTLSSEGEKTSIRDFEKLDVTIKQLNLNRKDSKQVYLSSLNHAIRDFNPDIVHTHMYRSDRYISQLKKKSFKHVTTLHNFPFNDYSSVYGRFVGTLLACLHLSVICKIKYKIACSYSIAEKFNKIGVKEIFTIQNGVNVEVYKSINSQEKQKLRERLGLPLDKKIIISSGSLITRKRPERLIQTFSKFEDDRNVLFIILGDGKLAKNLKRYGSPSIRFLGSVSNVVEYLQASEMFVSNSRAEGLPMAMLEAASTGLVIVGSNIKPHVEVKKIYPGKTILYQGQRIETIEKSIRKALTIVENNSTSKNEEFLLSSVNMAKKYAEFYSNIIK